MSEDTQKRSRSFHRATASILDFRSFCEEKRVFDVHTKVSGTVLDLGVSEQDLTPAKNFDSSNFNA